MYLWNRQTGDLYLWENLAFTDNLVTTGWNTGATLSTLQTTDINTDGVPDLWSVTPNGTATAHLVTNLSTSGPAKIRAKAPQSLS